MGRVLRVVTGTMGAEVSDAVVMVVNASKGDPGDVKRYGQSLEVRRGDEQSGDKDNEIGLLVSRYAGRFNFEVEARPRISSLGQGRV